MSSSFCFDEIITREAILARVSEEQIFEKYLGIYPQLGEKYVNTLNTRPKLDTRPGCNFFERSDGRLIFKDWGWKNLDCFDVAQASLPGFGWQKTLQQIAVDFGLIKGDGTITVPNRDIEPVKGERLIRHRPGYTSIQIKRKEWKEKDLDFWQLPDREVTPDELEKGRIFPISHYWLDGFLSGSDLTCSFGYQLGSGDRWQIYRPKVKNKRYKFRQSSSSWVIGTSGLKHTGYVLIEKSYKDYFNATLLGYNAVCVLSETMQYDEAQVQLLDSYGQAYLNYDNDSTGLEMAAARAEENDWRYITYPKEWGKDLTECLHSQGCQAVKDFLDENLNLV